MRVIWARTRILHSDIAWCGSDLRIRIEVDDYLVCLLGLVYLTTHV